MTDVAHLRYDIDSSPAADAANDLDRMSAASKKAEQAAVSAAGGARKFSGEVVDLLQRIERSTRVLADMAQAERVVEQATASAAGAIRAEAQAAEQASSANVRFSHSFQVVAAQAKAAAAGADQVAASTLRAGAAAESAAMDFATMYDAHDRNFAAVYAQDMGRVSVMQGHAAKSAGLLGHEVTNLGRQFADLGVMTAMGFSPFMILVSQGPQIADIFATASQRGVGFAAALKDIGAMSARVLGPLTPLIIVTGAVAAGFAMLNRELAKGYPQDITDGLGLTEEQLKRVESRTVTLGDTFGATMETMARYLTSGPIGDGIDHLESRWNSWLDEFTQNSVNEIANVVGAFVGAYRTVINNWQSFPAAFGGAVAMGVNLALDHLQKMINGAGNALNNFISTVNGMTGLQLPTFAEADLSRFKMQVSGAGEFVVRSFAANFETARDETRAGLGRIADEIRQGALARAQARALEEAGDPKKQADESRKAIDEQARAFERAKEAADRYLQSLVAQTRQLTMTRAEITALEARQAIAAAPLQSQKESIRLASEWLVILQDVEDTSRQTLIDTTKHLREAAVELDTWRDQFERVLDITRQIEWGVDDLFHAIKNKNWGEAFAGIMRAIDGVKEAWASGAPGARSSAIGSVLTSAGGQVGGKAGGVISGIGSGFSAAGAAAGMAGMGAMGGAIAGLAGPIGIAVAGFSILSKVLSDGAAKKRAKAEAEANDIARARQIAEAQAAKQAELQIELLRASGREIEAVAKERERELAALDATSAALQRQIYALNDWKKAVTAAEGALSTAEADLRAAYERELAKVGDARAVLTTAYNRERDAISAVRDKFVQFAETLRRFRGELNTGPAAMLSPEAQYTAAKGQFQSVSAAAMGGDEKALAELQSVSQAYLDASRAYYASSTGYFEDLEAVRAAVSASEQYAESQVDIADQQLMALERQVAGLIAANDNLVSVEVAIRSLLSAEQAAAQATAQVSALISIDNSVMTLAQALANYASATQALAEAQAAKPANDAGGPGYEAVGFEGYVQRNADLAALFASGTGMARGRSMAEFGAYHWERYGQAESRPFRPFANGGMFGAGGVVMGPTSFPMGLAGEAGPETIMPLANVGGQMGVRAVPDPAVVEALNEVRDELRKANAQRGAVGEATLEGLAEVTEGLERVERKVAA